MTKKQIKKLEADIMASDFAEMQKYINNGWWGFEGSVGRAMMDAINAGMCMLGEEPARDYYGNRIPSRYEVKPGTKGSPEFVEKHFYEYEYE